jgi:hypothetical protein
MGHCLQVANKCCANAIYGLRIEFLNIIRHGAFEFDPVKVWRELGDTEDDIRAFVIALGEIGVKVGLGHLISSGLQPLKWG